MIQVNKRVKIAIEYFAIAFGAAIMAIGIGVFLVDAKVVPGGVSGLSMAVHYLTGLQVGLLIWILNIPLYIWGVKELGKEFGVRTFFGFTLNSFFIDFFRGDVPGFPRASAAGWIGSDRTTFCAGGRTSVRRPGEAAGSRSLLH